MTDETYQHRLVRESAARSAREYDEMHAHCTAGPAALRAALDACVKELERR